MYSGDPIKQHVGGNITSFERSTEEINYNEHYEFGILQGRLGFGVQGTHYN